MTGRLLVVSLAAVWLSVACTGQNGGDGPEGGKPPVRKKPIDGIEQPLDVWTYIETVTDGSEEKYPLCPEPFDLGGPCEISAQRCHRKNNIYGCYPEDQQVWIYGRVVDENGQPLAGARVMGGLGMPGFSNLTETVTNDLGAFGLHAGFCLNIAYAQADGYVAPWNYFVASQFTRCIVQDYRGAKGVVVQMKRAERTVPADREPREAPGSCVIVGRVVDQDRNAIAGALVTAQNSIPPSSQSGQRPSVTGESGADGIYSIRTEAPCHDTVTAQKEGYRWPQETRGLATSVKGRPADIVLEKETRL